MTYLSLSGNTHLHEVHICGLLHHSRSHGGIEHTEENSQNCKPSTHYGYDTYESRKNREREKVRKIEGCSD
jgi:hypothetical protein